MVVSGTTALEALTLTGGRPLPPGAHNVWVYAQLLGVGRHLRVTALHPDAGAGPHLPTMTVGTPPRLVIPNWTPRESQLRLSVGRPGKTTVAHRALLRTTTSPALRRRAHTFLHHLPPPLGHRVTTLVRRADPWTRPPGDGR
ncbi:hypothetical protein QQY66_18010 [Streptomyces sp. DG2A-72]|uniref:hypothetical protein n=1 Tax=Streptomyces sp. DG2A-72 TaxID=3051386 RepID=UPI00265C278F|nr:hypothetical protein [Streptomyces sp. DG2A-72]MDO0933489.1 hypothetical protein [Streptomyces sp. DG2A-72]